jgi:hypothetical protein
MTRRTNLALLVVLVAALATGGLAFAAGTGWGRPVAVAAVAGLALAAVEAVTRRGGRPLSAGHGFPARLVAPAAAASGGSSG